MAAGGRGVDCVGYGRKVGEVNIGRQHIINASADLPLFAAALEGEG